MRRWLKRIVIVFAVFVLPPVAFYFYTSWQGKHELRAILDDLDANETPWRLDDLQNARPPLAPEDDVRPLIVKIVSLRPRNFDRRTPADGPTKPNQLLWPEHVEIHAADLKAADEALALARGLGEMPRARLRIRWAGNLLVMPSLDDLQKARSVANLLRVSAIYDAHLGDLDVAMEKCLALQRLSATLEEYGMINHLLRLAVQGTALATLERVVAQGQPSPAQLERLQQAWEQFDSNTSLMAAFRGERAISHWMFDAMETGKVALVDISGRSKGFTWEETFHNLQFRFNVKQSHAWILRHWGKVLEALELPEPERTARVRELDKAPQGASRAARLFFPTCQNVLEAHQRHEIHRRCAVVGLACERFRRAHDRWPKTLEELSPKFIARIPDDPHTNQPLRWRATADGIVIYSPGPDGKLNGAYHDEPSPNSWWHSEYEFRLWNVNQRRQLDIRQP